MATALASMPAKKLFTRCFLAVRHGPDSQPRDLFQWIKLTTYFENPEIPRGTLFAAPVPLFLEPFYSGVCVFGLGVHNRSVAALRKHWSHQWIVDAVLGRQTVDHYFHSPLVKCHDTSHVSDQLIVDSLQRFIGEVEQINPGVLYQDHHHRQCDDDNSSEEDIEHQDDLAAAVEDARTPRIKQCDSIELLERKDDRIRLRVVCDARFNCRALIRDLGAVIQCPSSIHRQHLVQVGPVTEQEALPKHEVHYQQLVRSALELTPKCIEYLKHLRKLYPDAKSNYRYI